MELNITNLSKTYPSGVQALKNVTLTITGGIYGLLGPAGAGKSTLMRILARLQDPDEGSVSFGSLNLLRPRGELQTTLGYLPQEFGRPKANAVTLFDRLAELKRCTERPRLLMVDESIADLEPSARLRTLDLLRELGDSSIVLLSTRSVHDVGEVCTGMAIINDGCILLEAEPRRAAGQLCGRIWTREIAKEALPRVQREYGVISTTFVAGRPVVRVYSNVAPAVGFERTQPELEDVYLSVLAGHIGAKYVQTEASIG